MGFLSVRSIGFRGSSIILALIHRVIVRSPKPETQTPNPYTLNRVNLNRGLGARSFSDL